MSLDFTVKAHWEMFRDMTVPKDAGETQLTEMEGAFFAGAASLLSMFKRIGEDDSIGDDKGAAILRALEHEVKKWGVERMAQAAAEAISAATGAQVTASVQDVTTPQGPVH